MVGGKGRREGGGGGGGSTSRPGFGSDQVTQVANKVDKRTRTCSHTTTLRSSGTRLSPTPTPLLIKQHTTYSLLFAWSKFVIMSASGALHRRLCSRLWAFVLRRADTIEKPLPLLLGEVGVQIGEVENVLGTLERAMFVLTVGLTFSSALSLSDDGWWILPIGEVLSAMVAPSPTEPTSDGGPESGLLTSHDPVSLLTSPSRQPLPHPSPPTSSMVGVVHRGSSENRLGGKFD